MSYEQLLAEVPMFEKLAREDVEYLSGRLQQRRYVRDEVIFHQGDVGTGFFIVRRGEVVIRLSSPQGQEVILTVLSRGDSFGELALLDGKPRSADAVAREETHLLILLREDFQRFLTERPLVSTNLLPVLAGMVRRVTQQVHDAAFLDARARLARVLLELARTQGRPAPEGVLLPRCTQAELAKQCGVTRESVNRWLGFYKQEQVLTQQGGKLLLLKLEVLRHDVA